jgi:hypothetical protein
MEMIAKLIDDPMKKRSSYVKIVIFSGGGHPLIVGSLINKLAN